MKLYIVRHGETLFNAKHRIQGWCDSPLTETGRKQAEALGRGLFDTDFVKAYCSTLERTEDTANAILKDRDVPLERRRDLKEINFGTVEGDPEENWFSSERFAIGFEEFGGETMPDAGKRTVAAWERIASGHETGNVLIVSHGGVISAGLDTLEPGILERLRQEGKPVENCSVSILEYENGELKIISAADISYRERGMQS